MFQSFQHYCIYIQRRIERLISAVSCWLWGSSCYWHSRIEIHWPCIIHKNDTSIQQLQKIPLSFLQVHIFKYNKQTKKKGDHVILPSHSCLSRPFGLHPLQQNSHTQNLLICFWLYPLLFQLEKEKSRLYKDY